jgi:membrane protein required for colicin V production
VSINAEGAGRRKLVSLLLAATTGNTTTWLEPAITAIVVASTLIGAWRGLIRTVAGLIGLVLAAFFAGRVAAWVDPVLKNPHVPPHPPVNGATAFVIAFLMIYIAVEFAAGLLRWLARMLLLGWVDRLGGAILGFIRGVILAMVLVVGLELFGKASFNATVRDSAFAVWLWQNAPALAGMIPPGAEKSIESLVNGDKPFTKEPSPRP